MLLESIAEVPDLPATFHASHQSDSDLLGDNRAEIQLMKAFLRDRARVQVDQLSLTPG